MEAAAQAIWAAEDVLGRKVKRRQRGERRKQLQDFWTTPAPPPPPPRNSLATATDLIIID